MQVCSDNVLIENAFLVILAVIAVSKSNRSERFYAVSKIRPSAVILKARHRIRKYRILQNDIGY